MSKTPREPGRGTETPPGGERAGGRPGKTTRTQALAAGASVHRVAARPSPGRFKPTEIGQSRHDVVTLTNVSDEPVDFFDFLETVLAADGTERPRGDFAVVGGATTGEPLEPGAAMPITVAFAPQASHPRDLARRTGTRRTSRFAAVDFDGATAGTFELEGRAIPPRDAEAAEAREEVDDLASAARHGDRELPPPRTYDDMLHHLQAARELMLTEERGAAGELVEAVRAYMRANLHHEKVYRAYRDHGLGRETALRVVGEARDRIDSTARAIANPEWRVHLDSPITALQVAQEPIQFVLGERGDSPGIRAMHDAAPVVLAGRAAEELGETAVDMFSDAAFAAGFGVGVLEGTGGAIKDLTTGVAAVLELGIDLAKELITGGLVGLARHIATELSAFFDKAPEALAAMGASFQASWNAPGSFDRGNFRGEVISYVATQIAIIVISGGAAAEGVAFAAMSRWGQLVTVIQKLDAAGDIIAWAARAKRSIQIADELLQKLRRGRASSTAPHVDSPNGNGASAAGHAPPPAHPVGDGLNVAMANKGSRLVHTPRAKALEDLLTEARDGNVVIQSDGEAERLLDWAARQEGVDPASYHAVTIGDSIFVRPEHATNVRVLREELIHVYQQRRGISTADIVNGEIEARLMMIRYRHRWGITVDEVREMIVEIRKMRKTGRY